MNPTPTSKHERYSVSDNAERLALEESARAAAEQRASDESARECTSASTSPASPVATSEQIQSAPALEHADALVSLARLLARQAAADWAAAQALEAEAARTGCKKGAARES